MRRRLDRLREELASKDVDGFLVSRPENMRYLSGFTGSSGALLITGNDALLLTDFRYEEEAREEAPDFTIIRHGAKFADTLAVEVERLGIGRLGFESGYVTWKAYEEFVNSLNGVSLIPLDNVVEGLRMVKDENEISAIERAVSLGDEAFKYILGVVRPGIRERDVALELEWYMRKSGAEKASFDIIVASGTRAALPHWKASDKRIEAGDPVVMDFGCYFEGYASDMTRTIFIGKATDEQKRIYDLVLEAQMKALDALGPGKTGEEVDAVARGVIDAAGYKEHFGHGTGHGVGLAIHEEPRLSRNGTITLAPGMVVTVEPGIYINDWGGIRIEDLAVVREYGRDILTRSPKELIEV